MADNDPLAPTGSLTAVERTEPDDAAPSTPPASIGRYRIERVLGRGGFGLVFLAHDEQLDRRVAVKVPHARLVSHPEDAQAYLAEARTVANLDHPHIVPVHDVGGTSEFPCYVVSKYIEGADLSTRLKQSRLSSSQAAKLVATVAEALYYAHKQGLVHRDVKPGNILLDKRDEPFVVDFGLALREQDVGKGPKYAGTPAYMSPEQARGEGHRVDGRSDIFSLGVVFYELLVGRRPFKGDSQEELLEQVTNHEPRPPRQYDDTIPKELERICQKALSKRASERYSTAKDMADDLWHWEAQRKKGVRRQALGGGREQATGDRERSAAAAEILTPNAGAPAQRVGLTPAATPNLQPLTPVTPRDSDAERTLTGDLRPPVARVVPKGLRSFDEHDADFFLQLLPGPTDRDGLPESIRFWKTRIEETDTDKTFSVGLIYGPSGCGKSSLVKAGLLPRLAENVASVYLEATAGETELRLLNGLRKRCRALPDNLSLKDTLAVLRRGQGIPVGKKVLIVLDQFEQWLHAKRDQESTELVQALRHCDGGHVQCVVMVRDDFWLAVSRFVIALEVDLVPGRNIALTDLFDVDHARKVLAALGRAFGKLPEHFSEDTKEQRDFLNQAVAGLAEDGKVICVRLALFAEMMKGRPWTPDTLKEVGGTAGVGVTFLEETFSSQTANPKHRLHQKGARGVLEALLPESGTDIKGSMRSHDELLEASGYTQRPQDFGDLLRILDGEVRLITPTDPEGVDPEQAPVAPAVPGQRYYQLTHDYLVPSLRDWLTRKQRETRRGRAELRLAERSALWSAKPQNRHLPSWWEYLGIVGLTKRRTWTEPQRRMIRRAGRSYAARATSLVAVLALLTWGGYELNGRFQARALVHTLLNADVDGVPTVLRQLEPYRRWATPALVVLAGTHTSSLVERRAQLHARLALGASDQRQVGALVEDLLTSHVSYVGILREQLAPCQRQIESDLWKLLRDRAADPARRFRAGLALASYASKSVEWSPADAAFLAGQLVAANPEHQPRLREYLRPLDGRLLGDLERIFADRNASASAQLGAANALADFAADDAPLLAWLLAVASPQQYALLYPLVAPRAATPPARQSLERLVREPPAADLPQVERLALGRRRAGAAITLLRQGERDTIFDALRVEEDPESQTQFIHRFRARGVAPVALLECVRRADAVRQDKTGGARWTDDGVLYALLLALGEFDLDDLPGAQRDSFVEQLAGWYAKDASSAIHGAAGWLLRHWHQKELARKVDQTPVPYAPERQWYTLEFKTKTRGLFGLGLGAVEQSFYITFVVFPAGEYLIGSPSDEADRKHYEPRHAIKLTRPIAVSDREITWAQFNSFDDRGHHDAYEKQFRRTLMLEEPAFGINWYEAVRYFRWLSECAGMAEEDQAYSDPASLGREQFPADPDPLAVGAPRNWPVNLEKRGFRLPTEAEWEMVCRGGTNTAYSFGNDAQLLGHYGWFQENSETWVHAVGQLRPNPRGLFDVHGNMSEWSHDWFGDYAAETSIEDPTGPAEGQYRVYRSGAWSNVAADCRSAYRGSVQPVSHSDYLGFRVAHVPFSQASESGSDAGSGSGAAEGAAAQRHALLGDGVRRGE